MDKLFASHFFLGKTSKDPDFTLDDVVDSVKNWLEKKKYQNFPEEQLIVLSDEESEASYKDRKIEGLNFPFQDSHYFGLRFSHSGFTKDDSFITDIVLKQTEKQIAMSTVLMYGDSGMCINPRKIVPTKPGIVNNVVQQFGAHDGTLTLISRPLVPYGNMEHTAMVLRDDLSRRNFPIIYVSKDSNDRSYINTKALARLFTGIAAVFEQPNFEFGLKLEQFLPDNLRCYNGAIRVYWPSPTSNGTYNRYWKKAQLEMMSKKSQEIKEAFTPEQMIFNYVATVANLRMLPPDMQFANLRLMNSKRKIEKQIADGMDIEELAEIYAKENEDLRSQVDELNVLNQQLVAKVFTLEQQIARKSDKEDSRARPKEVKLDSLKDALEEIEKKYGSKIVIHSRVWKSAEGSSFDCVENAYKALEWLVTSYHDHRYKQDKKFFIMNLSDSCYSHSGFTYARSQSDNTMRNRKFRKDYEVEYGGRSYFLKKHLKFGNSRDERKTLRIGFEYLKDENKVLLGYMDMHQRNRNSK